MPHSFFFQKVPTQEMALDLSILIQYLDAISALAVTLGVIFVVFQLRQNAKLIEASNRQIETMNKQVEANLAQNRQQVILATIDRFTDESFARKRKKVRDIVKKHAADGWANFLESDDDYEVRGFLGLYDSTGFLAEEGIVDVSMLAKGMGYLVALDRVAVDPAIKHYRQMWIHPDAYANFEWLYNSVRKIMEDAGVPFRADM